MGEHFKTLQKKHKLSEIYKYRFGLQLGLQLNDLIFAFYGDGKITGERKEELRKLRKVLRKERIRNIIPHYCDQPQLLDDSRLPSGQYKLSFPKKVMGWIYIQPKSLGISEEYRNICDKIAYAVEQSGNEAVKMTREEITREEQIKVIEKELR